MTVNDVVIATMNRVAELSLKPVEETRPSPEMKDCEFERLLQRAMEVLAIRAGTATALRS